MRAKVQIVVAAFLMMGAFACDTVEDEIEIEEIEIEEIEEIEKEFGQLNELKSNQKTMEVMEDTCMDEQEAWQEHCDDWYTSGSNAWRWCSRLGFEGLEDCYGF